MSKKHKKQSKFNKDMMSELNGEFKDFLQVEPLKITLNRMTVYGLRNLGQSMVDIIPESNGQVSEAQLANWAIHVFLLMFQREDVQHELHELIGEALSLAKLSDVAEKMLP